MEKWLLQPRKNTSKFIRSRDGWSTAQPRFGRAPRKSSPRPCSPRALPRAISRRGITNQRETTVVWNRKTGQAVYNAIVWQDTRVSNYVDEMSKSGGQDRFRAQTGLPLATYFSGLKIRWVLENVPGVRALAEAGDVIFGNIDTFLLWHLTGGPGGGVHVTDVTNASRTVNDLNFAWDPNILSQFGIPAAMLPRIARARV